MSKQIVPTTKSTMYYTVLVVFHLCDHDTYWLFRTLVLVNLFGRFREGTEQHLQEAMAMQVAMYVYFVVHRFLHLETLII